MLHLLKPLSIKLNNQIQLTHKITNVCDLLPVIPDQPNKNYNTQSKTYFKYKVPIHFIYTNDSHFHVHQLKGKSVDKLFGKIDFSAVFF